MGDRRRFRLPGQKCSACSRAIIDERIYDKFLEKLKARVEKITVGDPAENANMGAVINEGSMKSISQLHRDRKERRTPHHRGGPLRTPAPTKVTSAAHRHSRHSAKSRLEQEEKYSDRCWP